MYQTTVKEIFEGDAGNLTGAIISYLKPERNPRDGRTSMVPTGEEFTYNCQLAFIAAGFTGCESYVADAFGVELTARGNVADHSFKTNMENGVRLRRYAPRPEPCGVGPCAKAATAPPR